MTPKRCHATARRMLWSAVGGSIIMLAALLALEWPNAWSVAAAVLLLSCLVVCGFAALQSCRADRDLRRAVARLAEARRSSQPVRQRIGGG